MKTVNKRGSAAKKVLGCLVLALLLVGSLSDRSLAQEFLDVRLGFADPDAQFLLNPAQPDDDPIIVVVTVENVSGIELLATRGYADNLHLQLRFVDPDGFQITAENLLPSGSGKTLPVFPDEVNNLNVVGEPVELIPIDPVVPGDDRYRFSVEINARNFYNFLSPGPHTVRLFVHTGLYETTSLVPETTDFAQFGKRIFEGDFISNAGTMTLIADADRDGQCTPMQHPGLCPDNPEPDCEDRPAGADGILGTADDGANLNRNQTEILNNGLDDDCNPATPDVALVIRGTIAAWIEKHTVGKRGSKVPIEGMDLRAYDKSAGSCAADIGIPAKYYESIWSSCLPPDGAGTTDAAGRADLHVPPGEYLIIGKCEPDNCDPLTYVGSGVDEVISGHTVNKHLQIIVGKGKK